MPTIIVLDVSLSMLRTLPNLSGDDCLTYHQLAVQGINLFLDYLAVKSKLEYVSLMIFSTLYEIMVDFTRDYDLIRHALPKIEHYDKTCLENMLQSVSNILLSTWGTQNYSQVLVFTDCGIGFGQTSLKSLLTNLRATKVTTCASKPSERHNLPTKTKWIPFSESSKLSFICLGYPTDRYFQTAIQLYQELLDVSGQKGNIFGPKERLENNTQIGGGADEKVDVTFYTQEIEDIIGRMCEVNYKQFEAVLKCGGYFKLECPISIWPPPLPFICKETNTAKLLARKLEICGFLSLSDIGSPMSISRHLIMACSEQQQQQQQHHHRKSDTTMNEYEKLEADIKTFYSKNDQNSDDDLNAAGSTAIGAAGTTHPNDSNRESVCVLLHGALKVENMAALVLLNDNWFGFIYSYADSKKKSNLMLTVLPPGYDNIPWLGDLRSIGTIDDLQPGETATFPVKPEKRSYSQNCVVWIKQAGLQSDIQKVLRHAKKLPEKTQNFYKELNRIRRAALSLGFVELLEGMAVLFEREISLLPQNASPDCTMQLKHSAIELRKISNRDLKTIITALPTRYNQL